MPQNPEPILTPPPLLSARPPSPPRRGGRVWMVLALIFFSLLVVSVIPQLMRLARGFVRDGTVLHPEAGPRLEEVLVKYGDMENKIAVIPVQGLIMNGSLDYGSVGLVELIEKQLRRAGKDKTVRAVILKVDSPGGEVIAADEISRLLTEFQKEYHKPVVASLGEVAASGGYYVSAPCRWIVANDLTITGSIGVILSTWNYRGLMNKVGLRPEVFKSGRFKDMLRGSKEQGEITQEERDMIQALVNQAFEQFKSVVTTGRKAANEKNKSNDDKGQTLSPEWEQYADGRVLSGREAVRLGLADELGNFETAAARARKLAGLDKATLIEYRQVVDFSDLFRLFSRNRTPALKLDLGVDLPKLKAGQLYFLAPTYLQ